MPSDYLLDMSSRKSLELDMSNTIIIFDDAHGIGKALEDGVSFELTSQVFQSCQADLLLLRDKAKLFPGGCKLLSSELRYLNQAIENFSRNFAKWGAKIREDNRKSKQSA